MPSKCFVFCFVVLSKMQKWLSFVSTCQLRARSVSALSMESNKPVQLKVVSTVISGIRFARFLQSSVLQRLKLSIYDSWLCRKVPVEKESLLSMGGASKSGFFSFIFSFLLAPVHVIRLGAT